MAEEEVVIGDEEEEEEEEVVDDSGHADFEKLEGEKFINCNKRTKKDFIELISFAKQFFPDYHGTDLESAIKFVNLAEDLLTQLETKQYEDCIKRKGVLPQSSNCFYKCN